ncbi:MAG: adenosylcobinamide-GDP ribazoletransferase [Leptospirillia bacterium]
MTGGWRDKARSHPAHQPVADAVRFLTRLPFPAPAEDEGDEGPVVHPWTMAAFPLVGLFIGCLLWSIGGVLGWFLPKVVVDILLLALLAFLTGAIHWDGLMDTADALGAPRERRLEVLRDVHVGSFGMLTLVFVVGGQWAALYSLSGWMHGAALILFPMWGRWLMPVVTLDMTDLRQGEGLAGAFIQVLESRHILWGGLLAFTVSLLLMGVFKALALMGLMVLSGWLLRRFWNTAFGGVSGDLIGASCPLGELVALFALAAFA